MMIGPLTLMMMIAEEHRQQNCGKWPPFHLHIEALFINEQKSGPSGNFFFFHPGRAVNKIPRVLVAIGSAGYRQKPRGMHLLAYILAHWPVTTCYVLAAASDRNHRPLFCCLEISSERSDSMNPFEANERIFLSN
jgi:hypothetical protein